MKHSPITERLGFLLAALALLAMTAAPLRAIAEEIDGDLAIEEEAAVDEEASVEEEAPEATPAVEPEPAAAAPANVPEPAKPAEAPAPATPAAPAPVAPPAAAPVAEETVPADEEATEETEEETAEEAGEETEEVAESEEDVTDEVVEEEAPATPAPVAVSTPAPKPAAPPPAAAPVPAPEPDLEVTEEAEIPADVDIADAEPEAEETAQAVELGAEDQELGIDQAGERIAPVAWNPKDFRGAFSEFLQAGISSSRRADSFPARIFGTSDGIRLVAGRGEDILVTGSHPRGQVLAVYKTGDGSTFHKYIGLLTVSSPAAGGRSRARIMSSKDFLAKGDLVLPVEEIQDTYSRQREAAGRASAYPVSGRVVGVSDNRRLISSKNDVIIVDKGSRDGIGMAWMCELSVAGKAGGTTYGRVIRADRDICFVKIMKIYQPVLVGDRVRLSASPLAETGARNRDKR